MQGKTDSCPAKHQIKLNVQPNSLRPQTKTSRFPWRLLLHNQITAGSRSMRSRLWKVGWYTLIIYVVCVRTLTSSYEGGFLANFSPFQSLFAEETCIRRDLTSAKPQKIEKMARYWLQLAVSILFSDAQRSTLRRRCLNSSAKTSSSD